MVKQVVMVFNIGEGGREKDGQRLTTYFWQLLTLGMHAFQLRPKASIWEWARTPTGIPVHTLGKIWHTCFQKCPAQLFPMLKSKLGASLSHSLDNKVSLLFVFSTLWTSFPSETLSCFTLILSGSITMSMFEQSSSSHWSPHTAGTCHSVPGIQNKQLTCMDLHGRFGFMKGERGEQDTGKVLQKSQVIWSNVVNIVFNIW